MTTDDKEIVSALRARLADKVGQDRYELWFGASTQLLVRDATLTVEVPNRFHQDWLRLNFRKEIEASCIETLGYPLALEFRVDAALAPLAAAKAQEIKAVGKRKNAPAAGHEPPDLPRRRFSSLCTFVVGSSNCVAHQAALLAVERPGNWSPLLVHGPTGVGKTHLLEGIWTAFRKSHREANAIYLSAEQFTSLFLEALHGSGLPSFRRKVRGVKLLLIDDVQFFAGKKATLIELIHTIDTLSRDGRQLVFSADRSLAALKPLGPELMTRLTGGMVCRVEPPDYQTRLGIVRHLSGELGMSVPDDVQAYLASHLTTQSRELAGALKRLHATSAAHARPISLGMAEEALADLVHQNARVVRLADIEKAICQVFGLEGDSLQSDRKAKAVSHPRMLAMWLARKHTRAALSEIGHFFGRRSHSTVISAQKKIESWMAKGATLNLAEHTCKLEEAIRRVEENLRAG